MELREISADVYFRALGLGVDLGEVAADLRYAMEEGEPMVDVDGSAEALWLLGGPESDVTNALARGSIRAGEVEAWLDRIGPAWRLRLSRALLEGWSGYLAGG